MNNDRIAVILGELRLHKVVKIDHLAKKCFVSTYTIRRDLEKLEQKGIVRRSFGKVALIEDEFTASSFAVRRTLRNDGKKIIGELAADYVSDGNTILLSASSTVACIVPFLKKKKGLTIVTNSLPLAEKCTEELKNAEVVSIGGAVNPIMSATYGTTACEQLRQYVYDVNFFSAKGLSPEYGVMAINDEVAAFIRFTMNQSRKSICLCDAQKFGIQTNHILAPFGSFHGLVTDKTPDEKWMKLFDSVGLEVVSPNG